MGTALCQRKRKNKHIDKYTKIADNERLESELKITEGLNISKIIYEAYYSLDINSNTSNTKINLANIEALNKEMTNLKVFNITTDWISEAYSHVHIKALEILSFLICLVEKEPNEVIQNNILSLMRIINEDVFTDDEISIVKFIERLIKYSTSIKIIEKDSIEDDNYIFLSETALITLIILCIFPSTKERVIFILRSKLSSILNFLDYLSSTLITGSYLNKTTLSEKNIIVRINLLLRISRILYLNNREIKQKFFNFGGGRILLNCLHLKTKNSYKTWLEALYNLEDLLVLELNNSYGNEPLRADEIDSEVKLVLKVSFKVDICLQNFESNLNELYKKDKALSLEDYDKMSSITKDIKAILSS